MQPGTVDSAEIERFSREAQHWWDPKGAFAPLHRANRTRLAYIRDRLTRHFARDPHALDPFTGLMLLDVGSGGGLVAEPMARLGFAVTGLDADAKAVAVAAAHAEAAGLAIAYRQAAVEALAAEGRRFDAVLALEIAEHAEDQGLFFQSVAALLAPGGALIVSTLDRTAKSFALAILGAEYLLGWLPRGTHDWNKFLRPSEVAGHLRRSGISPTEVTGLAYAPSRGGWALGPHGGVNYFLFAIKPK
jgi:2-polyprenyl-6-hydroxyphenyl methylase/3-demethylubiquinone-9 3-methyltransferase